MTVTPSKVAVHVFSQMPRGGGAGDGGVRGIGIAGGSRGGSSGGEHGGRVGGGASGDGGGAGGSDGGASAQYRARSQRCSLMSHTHGTAM